MSNQIDLNNPSTLRGGTLDLGPPETPEDAQHRREQDAAAKQQQRTHETIKFVLGLLLIAGVVVLAAVFFFKGDDGQKRWAQAGLSTGLGAAIAYLLKK